MALDHIDEGQYLGPQNTQISAAAGRDASENSLHFPNLEWLASLTEEDYRRIFRGSPIKRAKWRGLTRNCCIALGNSGIDPAAPDFARIVTLLQRLAGAEDPAISESARWALSRIQSVPMDSERGANQNKN
jgi:epoxyqueuosine reductase